MVWALLNHFETILSGYDFYPLQDGKDELVCNLVFQIIPLQFFITC